MSKLFLIKELDDDCLNCPVKYTYNGGIGCSITGQDVRDEFIPDWCPLQPLPQYDMRDIVDDDTWDTAYTLGKQDGWNECLANILKGVDDE